jgi:hypothetical protein
MPSKPNENKMLSNPGDGGYSVDEALLMWVYDKVRPGSTILELGSGKSTSEFRDHGYKVISIEHDPVYVGKEPGVRYIYAPIELYNETDNIQPNSLKKRVHGHTGWYNREAIRTGLAGLHYDLILIDGPPRNFGRSGFLTNIALFNCDRATLVFDDMHRPDDLYVARRVAAILERDLLITNNGSEIVGQKSNGDMKAQEKKPFGILL